MSNTAVRKADGLKIPDGSIKFSLDGPNTNKLMGTTAAMEYAVQQGSWKNCEEGSTNLEIMWRACRSK